MGMQQKPVELNYKFQEPMTRIEREILHNIRLVEQGGQPLEKAMTKTETEM